MVVVVYDDEAYGAEVHHFGPDGFPLEVVRFPPADIAAIGRGFGCAGVTVRGADDLAPVRELRATLFVDSLAETEATIAALGWTTAGALGSGTSVLARDPDGTMFEFVEQIVHADPG